MPNAWLNGTLPVPFTNISHASATDTLVPCGAPSLGLGHMPWPAQLTTSLARQAPASRVRSAWHSVGQVVSSACRHGGGVENMPLPFITAVSALADSSVATTCAKQHG